VISYKDIALRIFFTVAKPIVTVTYERSLVNISFHQNYSILISPKFIYLLTKSVSI